MSVADYFLKIEGIEGESQDFTHKGELQLLSFTRGASAPRDEATGQASGKRVWEDSRFTMRIDKASPQLLQSALQNQQIKKAILTCRKVGGMGTSGKPQPGQEFFKITFEDAMVSSWRVHSSTDLDPTPLIEFSFNYSKISEDYCAQTQQGTLSGGISFADQIGAGR
jgi:type VI secretion system secreted protein Hcp